MEGIKADKREKKTKGFLNKMIRGGSIPAVCYNSSLDNILLSVDKSVFEQIYKEKANHIAFDLMIEGERNRKVIIKKLQYEPLYKELIHVDFYELADDVKVKTRIPISLFGDSIGVKLGGVLEHKINKLDIKALPLYIPSAIEIDISNLDVGDSIYVEDLSLGDNVDILAKPSQAICSCSHSRVTKLDEEGDEATDEAEVTEEEVSAE